MSTESLQAILSYVETLNMPEGEYLSVAGALKNVFNNTNNKTKWTTYNTTNIDDICIFFDNGLTDMSVKNYVKSISATNEPGQIKFKLTLQSELNYKNNPEKNKIFEYTIFPYGHRLGKLSILSELIEPTKIYMKFDEIECEYNSKSVLTEVKNRDNYEYAINYPDEDDNSDCVDNDRFLHIMLSKFINLCQSWAMNQKLSYE